MDGVSFIPKTHSFGSQSEWGEGHDGEEVTPVTYLLLSVQYCVPHSCFGTGQGERNEIRTIFLQVFLFLQPVTHHGRMQRCWLFAKPPMPRPACSFCPEIMSENYAFYSDAVYTRPLSTKGRARTEMSTWLSCTFKLYNDTQY